MIYRLAADAVVIVHFAFVVFVIAGAFLGLRWRWMPWLHLPAAAWGALIEFGGWVCPLTPLENALRRAGGGAAYGGGFVEHYIIPILYPPGLTRPTQIALGVAVLGINALAYWLVWNRRGADPIRSDRTRG